MATKQKEFYTTTTHTFDNAAITLNSELNDVTRMIKIGHQLIDVMNKRFSGLEKPFRRWASSNLDKDLKSILRYMCLANNQELLEASGIIRLSEAYQILGIDGNPSE